MSWWNGITDWWNGEDEAAAQAEFEAERARQAAKWRQAVAPTTAPQASVQRADPLETAMAQWRQAEHATAPAQRVSVSDVLRPINVPVQGPLRPGETRPMVPSVGPPIAPSAPPEDKWLNAMDAWRNGPPQQPEYNPLSSANTGQPQVRPNLYDVKPATVDYALTRPDTGVNPMTGQQHQAPTMGSPTAPYDPYAPPREDAWGVTRYAPTVIDAAKYAWQQLGGWQGAQKIAGLSADYAKEVGPVDWALKAAFGATPGYDYLEQQAKDSLAEGSNRGIDALGDNARNVLTALSLGGKAIETTQIPGTGAFLSGEDVSVGQLASAAGEAINRTLNPRNPNRVKDLFDDTPNAPNALGDTAAKLFWDILRNNQAVRMAFDSLPPELRTEANAAMVKLIAGPEETRSAIDAILNQDDMVAELEQKAQQALAAAQGLTDSTRPLTEDAYKFYLNRPMTKETFDAVNNKYLEAAQYGAQANELKNKTKTEIIDEHGNAWAEFLGGVILDPLNISLAPSREALQAAKAAALINMTPAQALNALDGVIDDATKTALGGNVGGWWSAVNPFARTADTNAHMATDILWRAAANIMSDVTDKTSARAVLDLWTNDPRQLVEGVVLPGSTEITKWGPGVVANSELR